MSQTIDFYIDVGNGQLIAAGSGSTGSLPTFTRNDVYKFRVRLQDRDSDNFLRDIDTAGTSVRIGVGNVDEGPSEGQFRLVLNGVTSSAITYNVTAVSLASSIFTAVSNNVSTVNPFGSEQDSFILTATQSNTALSFSGDSFTLFPTSNVLISTRRFPRSSVQAQQIVKLRRSPAVYADTFAASSTAGVVSLTKKQDGGTNANETYLLTVGKDAEGGGLVLQYGANSTTAIAIGATAASFNEALSSVTGIGANNISVEPGNNGGDYTITFVRGLGNVNITTALTLDASNVVFAKFLESTVTFATAELDEIFADEGTDTITPTLEIEISQSAQPKTIYQGSISVRKDLITTGSAVPATQASYYTKSEADALFVEDASTGAAGSVDAANRKAKDSAGTDSIDWETRVLANGWGAEVINWQNAYAVNPANNQIAIEWADDNFLRDYFGVLSMDFGGRQLISSNGTSKMFEWAGGIAFFGVTTKSQVTQGSAVSALINYGLLASSTTYGALPLSSKTLTTTASINFGTLNGHATSSGNVTVTGASEGDIVLIGLPSVVSSGPIVQGVVFAANTVCMTAINGSNTSKTIGSGTYRITVIGY